MQEKLCQPGLCPGHRCGAYHAPPDPLADGEGTGCPLLKNPTPAVGLLGLGLWPFRPGVFPPQIFNPTPLN